MAESCSNFAGPKANGSGDRGRLLKYQNCFQIYNYLLIDSSLRSRHHFLISLYRFLSIFFTKSCQVPAIWVDWKAVYKCFIPYMLFGWQEKALLRTRETHIC